MEQKETLTLLALLICLWGIAPLLSKRIYLSGINQITHMLFTSSFYVIIIYLFAYYNRQVIKDDMQKVDKSLILLFFMFALCFMFATNYTNNYLIRNSNPSYISSMTSITPVVTLLLSYFFLKEEITKNKLIGIITVVTGLIIMNKK